MGRNAPMEISANTTTQSVDLGHRNQLLKDWLKTRKNNFLLVIWIQRLVSSVECSFDLEVAETLALAPLTVKSLHGVKY